MGKGKTGKIEITRTMREAAGLAFRERPVPVTHEDVQLLDRIASYKRKPKLIDAAWWERVTTQEMRERAAKTVEAKEREWAEYLKSRSDSVAGTAAPDCATVADSVAASRVEGRCLDCRKPINLVRGFSQRRHYMIRCDECAQADSRKRLEALNARRTAQRAANRTGLVCQQCGKPLSAQRPTARYCGPTCRSQAWRGTSPRS
jgi:hypothetical protein